MGNQNARLLNQSYISGSLDTGYGEDQLRSTATQLGQQEDPAAQGYFAQIGRMFREMEKSADPLAHTVGHGGLHYNPVGSLFGGSGLVGEAASRQNLEAYDQAFRPAGFNSKQITDLASHFQQEYGADAFKVAQGLAPLAKDPFLGGSLREAVGHGETADKFFRGYLSDPSDSVERFGLDTTLTAIDRLYKTPSRKEHEDEKAVEAYQKFARQSTAIETAGFHSDSAQSGIIKTTAMGVPADSSRMKEAVDKYVQANDEVVAALKSRVDSLLKSGRQDDVTRNKIAAYQSEIDKRGAMNTAVEHERETAAAERAVGRTVALTSLDTIRAEREQYGLPAGQAGTSLPKLAGDAERTIREAEKQLKNPLLDESAKEKLRQTVEENRLQLVLDRRRLIDRTTGIPADVAGIETITHPNDPDAYGRYAGLLQTHIDAAKKSGAYTPYDLAQKDLIHYNADRADVLRRGEAATAFPEAEGRVLLSAADQAEAFGLGVEKRKGLLDHAFEAVSRQRAGEQSTYEAMTRSGKFGPKERAAQYEQVQTLDLALQKIDRERAFADNDEDFRRFDLKKSEDDSRLTYVRLSGQGPQAALEAGRIRTNDLREERSHYADRAQTAYEHGYLEEAEQSAVRVNVLGNEIQLSEIERFSTYTPSAQDRLKGSRITTGIELARNDLDSLGVVPPELLQSRIAFSGHLLGDLDARIAQAPENLRPTVAAELQPERSRLMLEQQGDRNELQLGEASRIINVAIGAPGSLSLFGAASSLREGQKHPEFPRGLGGEGKGEKRLFPDLEGSPEGDFSALESSFDSPPKPDPSHRLYPVIPHSDEKRTGGMVHFHPSGLPPSGPSHKEENVHRDASASVLDGPSANDHAMLEILQQIGNGIAQMVGLLQRGSGGQFAHLPAAWGQTTPQQALANDPLQAPIDRLNGTLRR